MRRLLFLSLLLSFNSVSGQNTDPGGARAAGMANTAINFTDIWSVYHNQAGLAHLEGLSAGAFYENRFLIREMAYAGAAVAMPISKSDNKGTVAVSFSTFGYTLYREGKYSLAYALKLNQNFSFGVQLNYHNLSINSEDYGSRSNVTAELGAQVSISEKVKAAAHLFNPTRTRLNDYNDERIPTIIRAGLSYEISENLILAGEVEKDIDLSPQFRAGIEYQPVEILYLRVGASSEPAVFNFGLGLKFEQFRFDLATAYHAVLGYSPQVSLTFLPRSE